MTLLFKKITTAALSLAMVGGVILSVGTHNDDDDQLAQAAQTNTHRRVYVYIKPSDWGSPYIHYWGTGVGTDYNDAKLMNRIIDYWDGGLHYYDVEYATTGFLIKNSASGDGTRKTNDILMSSLFESGGNYKVQEIWGSAGGDIFAQDTLPATAWQVAQILRLIDTCEDNDAYGYNAWPQLEDLFITGNSLRYSTEKVWDATVDWTGRTDQPTIKEKCDALEKFYDNGYISY